MTTVPGAKVVAVSDVDEARAREAASFLSGIQVYALGEDLILAREVEAVIVASWGPTHAAFVLAAIKAGKPVFCEKPLATTEADCSAILDAEAAFGRRLVQVGFMRRFDPAVPGDEGDDRIGRDRRAAHLPERPSQRVGPGALHRRHGADRHRGA